MKKSVLPVAIIGGLVLTGTIGAQHALAATPVSVAMQGIGQKYVWGGNDCSGFTMNVFKQFGIDLPHNAAAQANYGTYVSQNNLQPGDLVFFSTYAPGITHVGIYVGNNVMISSENEQVGVRETQIFGGGASSYWAPRYVTARRLISNSSDSASASPAPVVKAVSASQPSGQQQTSQQQTSGPQKPAAAPVTPATSATPATPAASQTAGSAINGATYTIQKGDTLSSISLAAHVSVSELKALNGLPSDLIIAGQTLKLSGQAPSPAKPSADQTSAKPVNQVPASAPVASVSNPAQKNFYMVRTGDTLWAISRHDGISISKIQLINHLKSTTIYPGQKLYLQETTQKYTIKKNDTLWGIATSHGITVSQLIKANNLTSTLIFPNQQLVIPQ